jgi:hypothetical protein
VFKTTLPCSRIFKQGFLTDSTWVNKLTIAKKIEEVKNIPVMQTRLLALPELKKIWCQPVATPVIRFRDEAAAETGNNKRGLNNILGFRFCS